MLVMGVVFTYSGFLSPQRCFVLLCRGYELFNIGESHLSTWGRQSCFPKHSGCGSSLYVVILCVHKVVLSANVLVMRCLIKAETAC